MYRCLRLSGFACVLLVLAGCGGGGDGGGGSPAVEPRGYAEPVLVAEVANVMDVSAAWANSCAVDGTGQAWCWGENEHGQTGCTDDIGLVTDSGVPYIGTPCAVASVTAPMQLAAITSSWVETCGLDPSGSAICWGYGFILNPRVEPIGPTPVDTTERFTILRATMADIGVCGLTAIGTRYCWGTRGTMAVTTAERLVAKLQDDGGLRFVDIALGQLSACGVTTNAEAWCWGSNWYGQLGVGNAGDVGVPSESQVPVKVVGDRSYRAIVAGLSHICALDTEGAAWCWGLIPGDGAYGTPQPVPGDHRFDKIFAGGQFTCGLENNGQAWCWGPGPFGELGNGSYDNKLKPVSVVGGLFFSTLALGGGHACGITTDQQLYCWGFNGYGQVGRPI